MVFSVRNLLEKQQEMLSVQEVYSLWDLLSAKNTFIELMQIHLKYIHDQTLKILLEAVLQGVKSNVATIKGFMKQYGIKSGDNPPKGVHVQGNSEAISDELIAQTLLIFTQEHIEMLLRAIRTANTSDSIRKVFIQMNLQAIKRMDKTIKFLKLKGWLNQPPLYQNIPLDTPELIDTCEAFHLWDHLTFRYDNIQQTMLYSSVAHDGDFKLLLDQGLKNILQKQAEVLEKECLYFGLPLPKSPPDSMKYITGTDIMGDDYLYRIILSGTQGASIMHALAFKQCVTNDRIRNIFRKLLIGEMRYIDRLIRFGKLKGWLFTPPKYRL